MQNNHKISHTETKLIQLQQDIAYQFNDMNLLRMAVTHKTGKKNNHDDYERLEFLGDRILALFVAEKLYLSFPKDSPGKMTPKMHKVVSGKYCADVARKINLGHYLIMSRQAEKNNVRHSQTALADACESLIAAIYLDSEQKNKDGKQHIWKFLNRFWQKTIAQDTNAKDNKTALQEWAQKYHQTLPEYTVTKKGPDNKPIFNAAVAVNQHKMGRGKGDTIKEAEQNAAKNALKKINT